MLKGGSEWVPLGRSDDVQLRAHGAGVEPARAKAGYVDGWFVAQVEVSHHLSDGWSHEEAMPGETGGVQESGHFWSLAHECVVVRGHLVEPGPPAGDAELADLRGSALDRLAQPRQPVVGTAELEPGVSSGSDIPSSSPGPSLWK